MTLPLRRAALALYLAACLSHGALAQALAPAPGTGSTGGAGTGAPAAPSGASASTGAAPLSSAAPAPIAPDAAKAPSPVGPLSFKDFAERAGGDVSVDPLSGLATLIVEGDRLAFKLGSPWYLLGERARRLPAPIDGAAGPSLPAEAAEAMLAWLSARKAERASHFRVAAILIDPGHGGRDSGAVGEFGAGKDKLRLLEKDLALTVALRVRDSLRKRYPERRIILSRDADKYPSLEERVGLANAVPLAPNEAIIYVSIHANASFNKNASGFEVWYLNPDYRRTLVDAKEDGVDPDIAPILNVMMEEEFTTESILLAQRILERLNAGIGTLSRSRGIRAEEWFVVRNARMPSVLVEMGFVTNEAEARLLADPAYLQKISDGVYTGILDFVDYFENRKGNPAP